MVNTEEGNSKSGTPSPAAVSTTTTTTRTTTRTTGTTGTSSSSSSASASLASSSSSSSSASSSSSFLPTFWLFSKSKTNSATLSPPAAAVDAAAVITEEPHTKRQQNDATTTTTTTGKVAQAQAAVPVPPLHPKLIPIQSVLNTESHHHHNHSGNAASSSSSSSSSSSLSSSSASSLASSSSSLSSTVAAAVGTGTGTVAAGTGAGAGAGAGAGGAAGAVAVALPAAHKSNLTGGGSSSASSAGASTSASAALQHAGATPATTPTTATTAAGAAAAALQQFLGSGNTSQLPTELPHEDEERLEKLFKRLDRDGNGRIDIHDLSEALHEFGLSSVYAEKFLEHTDKNQSGDVGLAEFVYYVREHEKNLRLQFSHLDKNKDGKVDLEELISAFKDLGIEVDQEEATHLLSRMDQDGSLNISFNEWRDFLLLAPSTDIHDLIKFWRHSTYLDIGEDLNVPDDFTQSEMQSGMWWRHLAAGGIAGAVSRTCTAPLDRIKVFLQVQTHKTRISDSLRYMLHEGGTRSLWRGNGINVLKIAPESAIKFAAYEKIKRLIRGDEKRQMTIGERFLAGAAAGGISQTVIYPMEVLKTRLALRKTGQYTGIVDAAKKIYLREGVRSFYRGYIPNMLGIIPYAGIDLAVYETLKKKYLSSHNTEQPSFLVLLACGSASSTLGQVCSYPLALVRTRLQAQVVEKSKQPATIGIPLKQAGAANDDNMFGVFRKIMRTEGICGLYRGITPNFIKVLPAVSISYVVYEYTSRGLGVNMT